MRIKIETGTLTNTITYYPAPIEGVAVLSPGRVDVPSTTLKKHGLQDVVKALTELDYLEYVAKNKPTVSAS